MYCISASQNTTPIKAAAETELERGFEFAVNAGDEKTIFKLSISVGPSGKYVYLV